MKKLLLVLTIFLAKNNLFAQVNVISPFDGSITIFPKGIIDSRAYDPSKNYKFIALGDSAFKSNTTGGDGVVAIGNKAMAKSQSVGYSVAIGEKSMYNATSGYANVAIGGATLMNNTGYGNTAIGDQVLVNNIQGVYNTAVGHNSLKSNESGSRNVALGVSALLNTISSDNIGVGNNSLSSNISGNNNLAFGNSALSTNTKASNNIGIGNYALEKFEHLNARQDVETNNIAIGNYAAQNLKTSSYYTFKGQKNVVLGTKALQNSTQGSFNTAIGSEAMGNSLSSDNNVAIGLNALTDVQDLPNIPYGMNTAVGNYALRNVINGERSVGVGMSSGRSFTYGSDNTFVGYSAGVTSSSEVYYNSMALGAGADVNASNKVVIGNASVSQIGGYASWVNYSDRRLKENIVYNNNLGLSFINALKTASYTYRADINKRRRDGLIAQDVQEVLENQGVEFSGLIQDNDSNKTLNLSYTELVIPLINAVKELSSQNTNLKAEMNAMQKDMETLKLLIQAKLETMTPTDK